MKRFKILVAALVGGAAIVAPAASGAAEDSRGLAAAPLLASMRAGANIVLVDVRPAGSFGGVRIPRSVNVPLFAVRTKAFLKGADVVLLDGGFSASALRRECAALEAAGARSARVLDGGIVSWAAAGGPLEGDPAALRELRLVDAGAVAAECASAAPPLVVAVDEAPEPARSLFPAAKHVPFGSGGDGFVTRLREALREANVRAGAPVLVADAAGSVYPRIQTLLRGQGPSPETASIYFLAGGVAGYRAHRERQVALINGKADIGRGGCPDCPRGGER